MKNWLEFRGRTLKLDELLLRGRRLELEELLVFKKRAGVRELTGRTLENGD